MYVCIQFVLIYFETPKYNHVIIESVARRNTEKAIRSHVCILPQTLKRSCKKLEVGVDL